MKICNRRVLYSSLAQSVERMTVNHDVVGSSPTGGAKKTVLAFAGTVFLLPNYCNIAKFTVYYTEVVTK